MISIIASSAPGLSPLARGTLTAWYAESHPERFIPAGAGNTEASNIWWTKRTVYPRWRGEHVIANRGEINRCGLSPLARGTPNWISLNAAAWRFIPAGAGNTALPPRQLCRYPVYPRWRGEHSAGGSEELFVGGLSPLARGTRHLTQNLVPPNRFIPAGAGNTHGSATARR